MPEDASGRASVVSPEALDVLIGALRRRGYRVVGPVVENGAVGYDELGSARDLPVGWTDEQEAATYRLRRRGDGAFFGFAVGPHSWKQFLFPPRVRLWRARRGGEGPLVEEPLEATPLAFVGARSCDLHAIAIQDRIFLGGRFVDRDYAARREGLFVVAVNCGEPGGTCFCTSMGTGLRATFGFDLALTEILEGEHRFLVEVGTEAGADVLAALPTRPAQPDDLAAAGRVVERAEASMGRRVEAGDLRELLQRNLDHPRWDDVAARCLSCTNCTLVCPTCFCSTVEDHTELDGSAAERERVWDSCFSLEHSYIHGGSIRPSGRSRYRQWLTHKVSTWHDQFGTSGCVGCGRCITWCPVGIDITEEVAAIRATDGDVRAPA